MRVLGVDYGERRIGLAVSDPSATLARPLRTLRPGGSLPSRAAAVAAEARALAEDADGLAAVVVGLPRSLDGTPHEQTARVLAFVDRLREAIDVPVALQDERLTSVEAESRLAAREKSWRKRSERLDAAAAAVILQDHLDEHRPPGGPAASPAGRVTATSGRRR
ncbi:MAG: Holliday junction resolvase RuvX [Acidobacteria bacterium]|nr:Holliday junction resolvase RuvX [Acidobacteriota bacterium]